MSRPMPKNKQMRKQFSEIGSEPVRRIIGGARRFGGVVVGKGGKGQYHIREQPGQPPEGQWAAGVWITTPS